MMNRTLAHTMTVLFFDFPVVVEVHAPLLETQSCVRRLP